MVDDLECFVLSIFVEFIVASGETSLSSQTGRFLGHSLSDFLSDFYLLVCGFPARDFCTFFKGFWRLLGTSGHPWGAQAAWFGLVLARPDPLMFFLFLLSLKM